MDLTGSISGTFPEVLGSRAILFSRTHKGLCHCPRWDLISSRGHDPIPKFAGRNGTRQTLFCNRQLVAPFRAGHQKAMQGLVARAVSIAGLSPKPPGDVRVLKTWPFSWYLIWQWVKALTPGGHQNRWQMDVTPKWRHRLCPMAILTRLPLQSKGTRICPLKVIPANMSPQ